jgi:Skp family chaperone for outer membrane proteins
LNTTTALSATARPYPVSPPVRRFPAAARFPASALLPLAALALLTAAVGCDKGDAKDAKGTDAKAAPSGGIPVGYVDLKDLAKQLRWEQEIDTKIKAGQAHLDRQRDSFERQIARAVEEKNRQTAAAARMNEQQTKELMTVRDAQALEKLLPNKALRDDLLRTHANAGEFVNRARGMTQQAYQQWYADVQKAYIDALRPIFRQVAEANGVKSVMTRVDVVVYVDPSVDLTNKIVDEAQKRQLTVTVPDAPTLQLPNVELGNPPAPATGPSAGPATLGPTTRGAPAMPPIGPTTPPR